MRIMVFKNKYKENPKHPDFTIYKAVDGEDLKKIGALWKGKSAKSGDFFSGTIDDEDTPVYEPETTEDDGGEDSIPF